MKYFDGVPMKSMTRETYPIPGNVQDKRNETSSSRSRLDLLEKEVRNSQQKLDTFFTNSRLPLFITDRWGRFTEVNQALSDLLGYESVDMLSLCLSDLFTYPELYKHFQTDVERKGCISGYETRLIKNDGETIDCAISADLRIDDSGRITGYQGSFTAIMQHNNDEQQLARREELQRLITFTSTRFLNLATSEIDKGIITSLQKLTGYTGADSCHIFIFSQDLKTMHCSHEWCKDTSKAIGTRQHNLPAGQIEIVKHMFETVCIMDAAVLQSLPEQCNFLKELWGSQDIQSIGGIPIYSGGNMIGFIGFESSSRYKKWTDDEIVLLKIMGEIFAGALERKWSEEALRETEARLRVLVDQSRDGIVIIDQDGRVYESNRQFAAMLGYSYEEVGKLCVFDWDYLVPPDQLVQKLHNVDESGEHFETKHKRKDGSTYDVEISTNATVIGDQKLIFCVCRDITQRKQAEEALRESEARFRTLIEQAADGIMVHDTDGKILMVNDQQTHILGYSREELYSADMSLVLPGEVINDHREKIWKKLGHGEKVLFEMESAHKDGSTVPTEIRLSKIEFNGTPAILVITRDITERKKAEEALRASEKKYRTLFENLEEGIIISDKDGKIIFANDIFANMLGYNPDEFLGKYAYEFAESGHNETIRQHIEEQQKGIAGHYQSRYRHKDGHTVYTTVNAGPMFNDKGEHEGDIVCYCDISGRVRAEHEREQLLQDIQEINRKLEQSNKELQDFAYIASHDLREPMRKISSFGLLLKESLQEKLDEDQQENFDFMIDGANRMQTMIDDLLAYSRLTTKAKPFTYVDMNAIIANLNKVDLAERLAETGGTIAVPETLPPVYGDPVQIHQLMLNLVNNGLKFHRENTPPIVTIRAHRDGNKRVEIEVSDNGIGIPPEYHEQIFTMFKRLHSRSEYDGTGIGLTVCSKIVSRHGGEIHVTSTAGEGATFTFTLPRESVAQT